MAKTNSDQLHGTLDMLVLKVLAPGRSGDYVAHEAEGEERTRLWAEAVDYYAGYATYQERAGSRRIPVVVLEPR